MGLTGRGKAGEGVGCGTMFLLQMICNLTAYQVTAAVSWGGRVWCQCMKGRLGPGPGCNALNAMTVTWPSAARHILVQALVLTQG